MSFSCTCCCSQILPRSYSAVGEPWSICLGLELWSTPRHKQMQHRDVDLCLCKGISTTPSSTHHVALVPSEKKKVKIRQNKTKQKTDSPSFYLSHLTFVWCNLNRRFIGWKLYWEALESMTSTAATTPEINNLIGWINKKTIVLRVPHALKNNRPFQLVHLIFPFHTTWCYLRE